MLLFFLEFLFKILKLLPNPDEQLAGGEMITYYDKIVYLIEELLKDGRGLSVEEMREIIEESRPDAFCARYDSNRENKEPVSEEAIKKFLKFCSEINII